MIIWNNCKFINKKYIDFEKDILSCGLITVPAAPAFVENENNLYYWKALQSADYSIIDSSLMALLARTKGFQVFKYSGYQLIKDTLNFLQSNDLSLFLINPNEASDKINKDYILTKTLVSSDNLQSYIAPFYRKNVIIEDWDLLERIKAIKPRLIIINIAGGKQEILGAFLKRNINFKTTIFCTGAAISFFTGAQAPISDWIDRFYLGWMARILGDPKIFFPRYLNAFKLIRIFYKHKIEKRSL